MNPLKKLFNKQNRTFDLGVLQVRVHLHRLEHVDDLVQSLGEGFEFAEDVHLGELEFTLVGHFFKAGLGLKVEERTQFSDDRCSSIYHTKK